MPGNRHTVNCDVQLSEMVCERVRADPNLRIMLYCSTTTGVSAFSILDVSFPNQLEVRMNGDEVKSNYKGLKNKPRPPKPADITDYTRKVPKYGNRLSVTYALTTKVCLCSAYSINCIALHR